MLTLEEIYPVLALRVTAGPVEMRGITDTDLPELFDVARHGIHAPDAMPFTFPWTTAPEDKFPLNFAQYHWGTRVGFSPAKWSINLVVRHEGVVVGTQSVMTTDFLTTRTGETGSWIGMEHQGRGIGTLMRQAMCAFLFDHLDFEEITSAAFTDNPASLAVSRKVGYVDNGQDRTSRLDSCASVLRLLLTPESFRRGPHPVKVEGLTGIRRLIGLTATTA